MSKELLYALLLLIVPHCAISAEIPPQAVVIDDFSSGLSKHWKEKSFKGTTAYTATATDGRKCLEAVSRDSGSGLYYEVDYSPVDYPLLNWSWKVEGIIQKGDARNKEGDDYAARVYVIFPHFLFWKTRAINYVWANRLPQETFIPNAFTANAVMVAVDTGEEKVGQWVHHSRNISDDYKKAFGGEPPRVGSIAIMSDTDNTGSEAHAWYGSISYSRK